jgi:hypothetical protein
MTEWSSWFAHNQLGLPTQTATVGNRYLMVVRVGDEWHWLVRNHHGRDLAKGFAYGPVEARSEAEAAATSADDYPHTEKPT